MLLPICLVNEGAYTYDLGVSRLLMHMTTRYLTSPLELVKYDEMIFLKYEHLYKQSFVYHKRHITGHFSPWSLLVFHPAIRL